MEHIDLEKLPSKKTPKFKKRRTFWFSDEVTETFNYLENNTDTDINQLVRDAVDEYFDRRSKRDS